MIYLFFLLYVVVVWSLSAFASSVWLWLIDHNYLHWYVKRITPMFILKGNRIYQYPSLKMRKENRALRKKKLTVIQLASLLSTDIWLGAASGVLQKDQLYVTKTHLLGAIKRAEKHGIVEVKSITPTSKRPLIEALVFIPLVDFMKNIRFFTRPFYKVEFYFK